MSLVKYGIRTLAQLGQEINTLFTKYNRHHALRVADQLLDQYYRDTDYDWREWEYSGPYKDSYIRTQVPINSMIPSHGSPLGYRYRLSGMNNYPFDMFVIKWLPGHVSDIHYHPVYGCSFITLAGKLKEDLYRFDRDNNLLKPDRVRIYYQGRSSYIDNVTGAHKISNIFDEPAVSLHIYAPVNGIPIRDANIPVLGNDEF